MFGLFRKKTEPRVPAAAQRAWALACIPVRNPAVRVEQRESGVLRLTYPLPVKPWVARLAERIGAQDSPMQKTLELDEMGTAAWELIDGGKNVADMAEEFSKRYSLHPREAETAMTAFLRDLGRRGIVGMAEPE